MPGKHEKMQFRLSVKVSYKEAVLKGDNFLHLPCYMGNAQNKEE